MAGAGSRRLRLPALLFLSPTPALAEPRAERAARPAAARARGCGPQRPSAVDDVSAGVLVGLPGVRALLVDAGLAPVADAGRERGLQLLPLVVRECDRVVVEPSERLEGALVGVGRDPLAGDGVRRAVLGLDVRQLADGA